MFIEPSVQLKEELDAQIAMVLAQSPDFISGELEILEDASNANDAASSKLLATLYEEGDIVRPDKNKAAILKAKLLK